MAARHIGLLVGACALLASAILPAPAGMSREAFIVAGLVICMAAWWMTEALPLTATALLPFIVLPFAGVMDAKATASAYYSDILFLLLGGGFIALAIERTGLHRRLALAILRALGGRGGQTGLLLAFMIAAAILSMLISNTSTTLIMTPMAVAVLAGGGIAADDREGLAGALPMGIAFAATIGGLGTLVGSPTNAIAVGLLDTMIGAQISFAEWSLYGFPIVLLGVPLAAFLVARVQQVARHPFDVGAARAAVEDDLPMGSAERRLMLVVGVTFVAWMTRLLLAPYLPAGAWTDGTIAIIASLVLFLLPDGTGRPLLVWEEANRAPWGVIMMFGIVVNNAILLVDHVNGVRSREPGLPLPDAIVKGTLERVRPILMTTATTVLGLLPLVLFGEGTGSNIWDALALVLIGGLLSSTLFVLTITPAAYHVLERGKASRAAARVERDVVVARA